jgi:ribose 5-phosphate isomerase B
MATRDEIREVVAMVVDATLQSASAPAATAKPAAAAPEAAPAAAVIAIGSDHGGYALKERLAFRLRERGHEVIDVGTHSAEPVDYPDFAYAVARRVAVGEAGSGIVVDGAGIGSAMAANKVPGVRAAMCYDVSSAINSREHNHANVLTLGAGLIGDALAWQIVEAWLATPWAEGRHARRVAKITDIEGGEMGGR